MARPVALIGSPMVTVTRRPSRSQLVPLMAIGPLIVYPFSKTLWVALDLAFFNRWRMQPGTGRRAAR